VGVLAVVLGVGLVIAGNDVAHELFWNGQAVTQLPEGWAQSFPEEYSEVPGVLTFRGSGRRTGGAFGKRAVIKGRLSIAWTGMTGPGTKRWGGGAGWTGEPVIIKWPAESRRAMGSLVGGAAADLVEVIFGSLDGKVYFHDLYSGKRTRAPISTGNPIKGSVSVDPRGLPLLFVGQGIPAGAPLGLRIYDLTSNAELFFLPGKDDLALRDWGAFDSSGLLNRATDSYITGAENGLLYVLKLHTQFDASSGRMQVAPEVLRYRAKKADGRHYGIESSIAVAKTTAYFADNGGTISAIDLQTFAPLWRFQAGDDTDASLTLELENGTPMLYTGSEVDKQGKRGMARLRKLDGASGRELWRKELPCRSVKEPRRSDGGALATNLVGEGDVGHLVIFTLSRCTTLRGGVIVALDKGSGAELWRRKLARYAWSSPTAVPSSDGHTYLLQADVGGSLHLLDARDGTIKHSLKLRGIIEASPAVYDDRAVIVTRARKVYGIRIQ
jgi:hypothetical protein